MNKQMTPSRPGITRSTAFISLLASLLVVVAISSVGTFNWHQDSSTQVPFNAAQIVHQCQALHALPGPPSDFHERTESDRYVVGTLPTLLRNASIWTGRVSGHEVIVGDVFLDKGLIKEVGTVKRSVLDTYKDLVIIDAAGSWVTPG